jgi:hypothetical protein
MILGLPESVFLGVHVTLSLVSVVSGLIVLFAMSSGYPARAMTALFLLTTILTSVTGFPQPPFGFDPPRAIGVLSLVLLFFAVIALYVFHLRGVWRWIYVLTAAVALYLNCFVAVVQAFLKIGFLHDMAPTQSEPPFLIAQAGLGGAFVILGLLALIRFRPQHIHRSEVTRINES